MNAFKKAFIVSFVFLAFSVSVTDVFGQEFQKGDKVPGFQVDGEVASEANIESVWNNGNNLKVNFATNSGSGAGHAFVEKNPSGEYIITRAVYLAGRPEGSSLKVGSNTVGGESINFQSITVDYTGSGQLEKYTFQIDTNSDYTGWIRTDAEGNILENSIKKSDDTTPSQAFMNSLKNDFAGAVSATGLPGASLAAGLIKNGVPDPAAIIKNTLDNLQAQIITGVTTGIGTLLGWMGDFINWIGSLLLALGGGLFEISLTETVGNLGKYIGDDTDTGKAIAQSWTLIKNIANLLFIFMILYVAIKIILRGNGLGDKRMLGTIIVVALLINFSLLFTKVIIDLSNAVSISLYNQITYDEDTRVQKSLGATLTSYLKLTTFSDPSLPETASKIPHAIVKGMAQLLMSIIAFPLYFAAAIGLGMAGVFLVLRLITFIFLMILSPLAFISIAIPGTRGLSKQWFNKLVSESISLPALLIFLYLTIILAEGLSGSMYDVTAKFSDIFPALAGIFSGNGSDTAVAAAVKALVSVVTLLINYLIIMASLFFALWGSRKIGLTSASWSSAALATRGKMIKYGLKPASAVTAKTFSVAGQNTVGRLASRVGQSGALNQWASQDGLLGKTARGAKNKLNKTAEASFDFRGALKNEELYGASTGEGGWKKSVETRAKNLADQEKSAAALTRKEQDIKDKYDLNQALYNQAKKKEDENKKTLETAQKDRQKLVLNTLKEGGDPDAANYEKAMQTVTRLEKRKKKNGSLEGPDIKELADAERNMELYSRNIEGKIRSWSGSKIDAAKATNLLATNNDYIKTITEAKGKKSELATKTLETQTRLIEAKDEYKTVEKAVKERQEKFVENVVNRTNSLERKTAKIITSGMSNLGRDVAQAFRDRPVASTLGVAGTAMVAPAATGMAAGAGLVGGVGYGASRIATRASREGEQEYLQQRERSRAGMSQNNNTNRN